VSIRPSIQVITFATQKNDEPYRDLSQSIHKLKESVEGFDIDFKSYSLDDVKKLTKGTANYHYLNYRKGVGAWFWKPIIISDALQSSKHDFILYMDADCKLTKDPVLNIGNLDFKESLGVLSQRELISDWASNRSLRKFSITRKMARLFPMWTAGILLVRNSVQAQEDMRNWMFAMSKPTVLLEPLIGRSIKTHRYDQTILSLLIATNVIEVHELNAGFYSDGPESTTRTSELAWVVTGNTTNLSNTVDPDNISFFFRFKRRVCYELDQMYRIKYWVLHFPRQLRQLRKERKK
jgi:hypothetical protein